MNTSQSLQYIVELHLTGTVDGSSACPLNTGERLVLLRTRKQRRRFFRPVKVISITVACRKNYAYDFVDGIFAFHYIDDAAGVDVSHLQAYDLSSKSGKLLFHTQLDFVLVGFSIDPSRDLIACSELLPDHGIAVNEPAVMVHLRSLSSGGVSPHFEADKAGLKVYDSDVYDVRVTLAGDKVAYFSRGMLYIWRWTKGGGLLIVRVRLHAVPSPIFIQLCRSLALGSLDIR